MGWDGMGVSGGHSVHSDYLCSFSPSGLFHATRNPSFVGSNKGSSNATIKISSCK